MGFLRKVSKITSGLFFRFSGVLDMESEKIVNVADGTNPQDAATKAQIDAIVAGTGFLAKDGTVAMTGALDLGTHKINNVVDPAANQDAATKKYTDDGLGLMIKKDGTVAMTGALDLGTHKINNVVDPSANQDAATKKYVDTQITGVNEDLLADATLDVLRHGKVRLRGDGKVAVLFKASTPGTVLGTNTQNFNLTGVGDGGVILVTPDAEGEKTATVNFAAGYHTGGTGASTNMLAEIDTKFKISVDNDTPETVTCDWVGGSCDTGAEIAAEMQTKIRALGGKKTLVEVAFSTDKYVITSPTKGKNSKVRITPAADHDASDELEIGTGYGTNTDGTGDVNDASAVTATEIVAVINGDMTAYVVATVVAGAVRITSKTSGYGSKVLMGNSTLKTVLGLAQNAVGYGGQGLGYAKDMKDTNYSVFATKTGTAQASLGAMDISTTNLATTGFMVECETNSSTEYVFVLIAGLEGAS